MSSDTYVINRFVLLRLRGDGISSWSISDPCVCGISCVRTKPWFGSTKSRSMKSIFLFVRMSEVLASRSRDL